MIEITALRHGVLSIPSLRIPEGLTFIRGRNGSGKTTLLNLAAGLILPEKGSILIDGKPPREVSIGYVSEFPARNMLFSRVSDEVSSSLRFACRPADEISRKTAEAADLFGITHLLSRDCRTLSGGEKVLTACAAAAVGKPQAVILDEPDSHLDAETAGELAEALQKSGIPYILWASHRHFADGFEVVL